MVWGATVATVTRVGGNWIAFGAERQPLTARTIAKPARPARRAAEYPSSTLDRTSDSPFSRPHRNRITESIGRVAAGVRNPSRAQAGDATTEFEAGRGGA
jgi:hypothetical protein